MISTHILDTSKGCPAEAVTVTLDKEINGNWTTLKKDKTNADGRINFDCPYEKGIYRLTFDIISYLEQSGQESFFQSTPVTFKISDTNRKYHVPLLLNPYGYSTYRGS
jgi:5-hydroxyisourate hydrolase